MNYPRRVSVHLPAASYRRLNQRLRHELRAYFCMLAAHRVTVGRGTFAVDIRPDHAYWLPQVEDVLADVGLDVDTGQVAR